MFREMCDFKSVVQIADLSDFNLKLNLPDNKIYSYLIFKNGNLVRVSIRLMLAWSCNSTILRHVRSGCQGVGNYSSAKLGYSLHDISLRFFFLENRNFYGILVQENNVLGKQDAHLDDHLDCHWNDFS